MTDPLIPTTDGLRRVVEAAGLEVVSLVVRRVVERENFIYCRARKASHAAAM